MAALHDSTTGFNAVTAGAGAVTNCPLTIAPKSSRYLIVHVVFYNNATSPGVNGAASVVWNGSEALSLLWEGTSGSTGSGSTGRLQAWGLKNPSAVSANVTITNGAVGSGAVVGGAILASVYYNVDQTTPTGTARNAASKVSAALPTSETLAVGAAAKAWDAAASPALTGALGWPLHVDTGIAVASAGAATLTPTVPASFLLRGDFVFAICCSKNTATHSCATSGWSKFRQTNGTGFTVSIWIAQVPDSGTISNPVITWTGSVACHAYTWHLQDALPTPLTLGATNSGTGATHSSVGGNCTANNSTPCYIDACATNAALAAPGGGWNEIFDNANATAVTDITVGAKTGTASGVASGAISVAGGAAAWVQQQIEVLAAPAQTLRASQINAANRAIVEIDEESYSPFALMSWSSSAGNGTSVLCGITPLRGLPPPVDLAPTLHTNTQTFYAPSVVVSGVKLTQTARHDNAQTLYAPKIVAKPSQTARFDNVQTIYAPKMSVRFAIAARHDNTQTIFAPKINTGVKPTRHDNAQTFYPLKLLSTVKVTARFDNVQTFYAPTVKPSRTPVAPFHTNVQTFYAPAVKSSRTPLAPFHTNAQTFYAPTVKPSRTPVAPFFTNTQDIYAPTVKPSRTPVAPFHTNTQTIYAPSIRRALKASRFDNVQVFYPPTLGATIKVGARFDNAQAFYPVVVNRVGAGIQAPLHTNTQQFYPPSITFKIGAPFHTNAQTFYPPRVATLTYVGAPAHENAQTFYPASLKLTVKPGRHDNAQTFYPAVVRLTVAPTRHDNAQIFYPPSVKRGLAQSVRHDNVQTFYPPAVKTRITQSARHDNAQVFYPPTINSTTAKSQTARHDNAQVFYPPRLTFKLVQSTRHDNAQTFYAPTRQPREYKAPVARHDNAQEFYPPTIRITVKPARFDNAQTFYPPRIVRRLVPARHDNEQVFFGPKLRVLYRVAARFDNPQEFYEAGIAIAQADVVFPQFVENAQEFFAPTVVFTEPPDRDPAGALRMFENAKFEFNGIARLTEFGGQDRRNVFRSRLITDGELVL